MKYGKLSCVGYILRGSNYVLRYFVKLSLVKWVIYSVSLLKYNPRL